MPDSFTNMDANIIITFDYQEYMELYILGQATTQTGDLYATHFAYSFGENLNRNML